jgi:4-aminobutyrate aminotransferase-like enzyme
VELVDDRARRTPATAFAEQLVEDLRQAGVLCHTIGPDENILKLRPPMVLSREDADLFLDILGRALAGR